MVKINRIEVLNGYRIRFFFNDSTGKTVSFQKFIGEDKLTSPLRSPEYFLKVQIYENGRGIFWPNGFDFALIFCATMLRKIRRTLLKRLEYKV